MSLKSRYLHHHSYSLGTYSPNPDYLCDNFSPIERKVGAHRTSLHRTVFSEVACCSAKYNTSLSTKPDAPWILKTAQPSLRHKSNNRDKDIFEVVSCSNATF